MISVRGLTMNGRARGAKKTLDGVNLEVPSGCLYGLIGPGAAGKSVLLKMITGLLKPDAGEVIVDGQNVTKMTDLELGQLRLKFGMLFQNNALFDHLTVGDNIAFPLQRLTQLPDDEVRRRVSERLACVALPGFESRMPGGLSGGQKKRVGVARATITQAPIVVYDEPAAGLDPKDLRSASCRATRVECDGRHGFERSRSLAHRHRSRRHALSRAIDLRRHDRRGEDEHRAARSPIRARPHRGAAMSGAAKRVAGLK